MKPNTRYSPKLTENPESIQVELDKLRFDSKSKSPSIKSDTSDTVVYNYSYEFEKEVPCPMCHKVGERECMIRWVKCGHSIKNESMGKVFSLSD